MSGGNVLSAGQAALVLFGVFIGLLIIRVPVAFALGLACLPILLIEPRLSMMMLAQETFNAYNSFILLAVPFFLLTANLMSIGGITDRLVSLSRAMVGVREAQHFEVDVWPDLSRRSVALVRILARLGILALALVFVWAGLEFTRFAWNRTSELADLPLWLIHVAWPVAGVTWIVFAGEQIIDEARIAIGVKP